MPCIDRKVKGRTTRRESQVIRTMPTPQERPTSLCIHLMTLLKTSISGWRMLASRNTVEFYVRSGRLDPPPGPAAVFVAAGDGEAARAERLGVLRNRRRS